MKTEQKMRTDYVTPMMEIIEMEIEQAVLNVASLPGYTEEEL